MPTERELNIILESELEFKPYSTSPMNDIHNVNQTIPVWVSPLRKQPENFPDDWFMHHWRYASDHYKLDTDLFEVKDGGLCKKGGTGRLEWHEVEWLDESPMTDLHQQIRELEAWKQSATNVFGPLIEYGYSLKELKPGQSISAFIIDRCKQFEQMQNDLELQRQRTEILREALRIVSRVLRLTSGHSTVEEYFEEAGKSYLLDDKEINEAFKANKPQQ